MPTATKLPSTNRYPWLPFASMNLLRNPFGELSQTERIQAAVINATDWIDYLRGTTRPALQFSGACGRGKSTHLLALADRFSESAYVYLPEDAPCPAIPTGSPLFIDEAQRLPRRIRREVFQRGVPLVLGTHRDLTRPLQRAGYSVQTVQVGKDLDAAKLGTIIERRIQLARLSPRAVPAVTEFDAARLIARFGDDVRSVERYLYEKFQLQKGTVGGDVRFID